MWKASKSFDEGDKYRVTRYIEVSTTNKAITRGASMIKDGEQMDWTEQTQNEQSNPEDMNLRLTAIEGIDHQFSVEGRETTVLRLYEEWKIRLDKARAGMADSIIKAVTGGGQGGGIATIGEKVKTALH
jgi:threonine dehydratase